MPYRPIDRSQVRTRDIILGDGNAYDVYMNPMNVTTDAILADVNAYENPVDSSKFSTA